MFLATLQYVAVFSVCLISKFFFSVDLRGTEHIRNLKKPFIIAANHPSRIDPIFLSLLPFSVIKKLIPLHFMMAEVYFENVFLRVLLTPFGVYPIRRWASSIEEYMERSLELLKDGQALLVFPEGKLAHGNNPNEGKPGIIYVAQASKCAIVPLHIRYEDRKSWHRRRIKLAFGGAFQITNNSSSKTDWIAEAQNLVHQIYQLSN